VLRARLQTDPRLAPPAARIDQVFELTGELGEPIQREFDAKGDHLIRICSDLAFTTRIHLHISDRTRTMARTD
jgi:hypothetical protein